MLYTVSVSTFALERCQTHAMPIHKLIYRCSFRNQDNTDINLDLAVEARTESYSMQMDCHIIHEHCMFATCMSLDSLKKHVTRS